MGKSRSSEEVTPGRSTPLDLNTTEDHNATYGAKRHETDETAYALIAGTVKGGAPDSAKTNASGPMAGA